MQGSRTTSTCSTAWRTRIEATPWLKQLKAILEWARNQPKGCRVAFSFLIGCLTLFFLAWIGFRLPEADPEILLFEALNWLGLPLILPTLIGGWASYKLTQPANDPKWTWTIEVGCLLWGLLILYYILLLTVGDSIIGYLEWLESEEK